MAVTVFQAIDPTFGSVEPAPFPSGYRPVATVDVADDQLGMVFRHTNTVEYSWYGPERPAIVTPSKFVEKQGGARSTSVGDVIALSDGSLKLCASVGWKDMETFDAPLVFSPGCPDGIKMFQHYRDNDGKACAALFLARVGKMHHHLESSFIGGDGSREKAWKKWVKAMLPEFDFSTDSTPKRRAYADAQYAARIEASRIFESVDSVHAYS